MFLLFAYASKAGSPLQTSDVTSTRTIVSCSLIIVTKTRTSSDTPLSSCLRMSRYESNPPLHSAYGYVVLPLIRTSIRTRYFLNTPLRDTRMMRERGKEGILFVPQLLCLRKRHRPQHRRWCRLRQKRLWSNDPSRSARRSTVRQTAARNGNRCELEGNAHVLKYRFRVPEQIHAFYFSSRFRLVTLPLPRTHCIFLRRVALSSN
jgi:hypothetical protein